jgi:Tfp pilus assembly protein PilO
MSRLKKFYIFLASVFVILSIAILAVEVMAYLNVSTVQSNLAEQEYRIEKLQEKITLLNTLSKNFTKFEKDSDVVNTALPDQKDASKLVSNLDSLATESGLKLTLVQSNTFGKKTSNAADPSLLQTVKGAYGYELPLEVKVAGPYQNFVNFNKRLENYQRLVNISAIEIKKTNNPEDPPDKIEVKLTLTAYLMK